MKDLVSDVLSRLSDIENLPINSIISREDLLKELCNIRTDITRSGFMNIPKDYTFDISSELKWSILCNKDEISKAVNKFNSIRTRIITYILEKIHQAKEERNKFSRDYFNCKKDELPGKIKFKYSNYFFRYFTNTDLEELVLVILPELGNFTILNEEESSLCNRMCIYYFPKLLAAYLFLEFRSNYLYLYLSRNIKSFSKAINIERVLELLQVGSTKSFSDSRLRIHIDSLIFVIRNKINKVALCYKSLSIAEKNIFMNQTIDKTLLIKILNVFNGKDFKQRVMGPINQKSDRSVFYKENFKDFIEDLYKRI